MYPVAERLIITIILAQKVQCLAAIKTPKTNQIVRLKKLTHRKHFSQPFLTWKNYAPPEEESLMKMRVTQVEGAYENTINPRGWSITQVKSIYGNVRNPNGWETDKVVIMY